MLQVLANGDKSLPVTEAIRLAQFKDSANNLQLQNKKTPRELDLGPSILS